MKRFLKHLFFGILYLAILGGIGYLFYLGAIKPPPSCFDHIQNQGESGVDCGGPCANICLPAEWSEPNFSGQAKIFQLPNGLWSALYTLNNPNQGYAAKDLVYDFRIKDASGAVIKDVSGHSFIYSAESKYITAPALGIGTAVPAQADFFATSVVWIKAEEFAQPKFQIQSPNISESSSSIIVTGRLVNQDTTVFPSTLLVAVFTSNFGDQVGVAQTTLENFAPGETRTFTIIHPVISGINLQSTLIFPYALRP